MRTSLLLFNAIAACIEADKGGIQCDTPAMTSTDPPPSPSPSWIQPSRAVTPAHRAPLFHHCSLL